MREMYEVAVGGDEHQCCGDAVELHTIVRVRARRMADPPRLVEIRHPAERDWDMVIISGRVVDIVALVDAGSERMPITRLPSGAALRGFDAVDDGLLISALDDEPLPGPPATEFVVMVQGTCVDDLPPDPWSTASTVGWWPPRSP